MEKFDLNLLIAFDALLTEFFHRHPGMSLLPMLQKRSGRHARAAMKKLGKFKSHIALPFGKNRAEYIASSAIAPAGCRVTLR